MLQVLELRRRHESVHAVGLRFHADAAHDGRLRHQRHQRLRGQHHVRPAPDADRRAADGRRRQQQPRLPRRLLR